MVVTWRVFVVGPPLAIREMRRTAALIAFVAMTFSMFEGVASSLCLDGGSPVVEHALNDVASRTADHDAPAPTGHHQAPVDGDCPISGAARSHCAPVAVVANLRVVSPTPTIVGAALHATSFRIPTSRQGVDLFHPPRA